MTTVAAEVLQWGWERARTGPWRGDGDIAYLAPLAPAGAPSVDFLQRCLETLTARGFTRVVTSALAPAEQRGFLAVGFEEYERLHLLSHDLSEVPRPDKEAAQLLRRGRNADWPAVLAVDASAFAPFWRLDASGLSEAIDATPVTRFRIASPRRGSGEVLAYAVTGLSANQGYLQRLAVHPAHRRTGLGRALGLDGLRWLRRKGVAEAVVNTQLGNEAALALYLSLGFRHEPIQLSVLHRRLG
ncbi:MAG TPA: GNAT family N-acetyltransferase [Acidimicrobiales bacterium]|nr:GNAT family N-acetyltransferase [Acidimicrobiales bacterium]